MKFKPVFAIYKAVLESVFGMFSNQWHQNGTLSDLISISGTGKSYGNPGLESREAGQEQSSDFLAGTLSW